MLFKAPYEMTDDELISEQRAIDKVREEILFNDELSDYVKREFLEHSNAVDAEYSYRKDGEYMLPLSIFGIVDF